MNIKNVKIRFNLDKENDRKAYEYLCHAEKSYSKAVISASDEGKAYFEKWLQKHPEYAAHSTHSGE